MTNYWLGVLTLPIGFIAAQVTYVTFKWALWLAGKITVTFVRVAAKESTEHQRARLAGMTFATKRCWMFATQDLGIAVFQGQRDDVDRSEIYEKLQPPVSLQRAFGEDV